MHISAQPAVPAGTAGRLTLDQLMVPPPELEPPYTRASLGALTWSALVRDGDVVELWDGHGLPAGMVVTPELRARSLVDHVPRDVVVGRRTAAWVHTGTPRPLRLCILYAARGYRPRNTAGMDVSQAAVRPWETIELGGLRVTDVTRTALDVATWLPDDEVRPVLLPLLRAGADVDECLLRLDRVVSWRGADRAREVLLDAGRTLADVRTGSGSPPSSSR